MAAATLKQISGWCVCFHPAAPPVVPWLGVLSFHLLLERLLGWPLGSTIKVITYGKLCSLRIGTASTGIQACSDCSRVVKERI
ncbi:hypothetical protein COO60DRAFT_101475 [Scenedesmus sp. NREL 46B-D3]|nr:hypothetical protein COO60DRAFT_101475 [Scenedesmus sp. NREL 46B-D3]